MTVSFACAGEVTADQAGYTDTAIEKGRSRDEPIVTLAIG